MDERQSLVGTPTLEERPILAESLPTGQKLPVCLSSSSSTSLSPTPSPPLGRRKVQKKTRKRKVVGDKLNNANDEAEINSLCSSKKKNQTNTKKSSGTPKEKRIPLPKPSKVLSRDPSVPEKEVITIKDDDEEESEALQDSIVLVSGLRSSSTKQDLMKAFSRCGRVLRVRISKNPPGYTALC